MISNHIFPGFQTTIKYLVSLSKHLVTRSELIPRPSYTFSHRMRSISATLGMLSL